MVFSFNFALLCLHEMDAIRAKEWKMFLILKDMEDKRAFKVFTILHLPLYTILIFSFVSHHFLSFVIIDLFIIFHVLVHFFFEKHPNNNFKNFYSRMIIYPMGILGILHLLGLMYV
ncbi:DUF6713 family protein [Paenibacillus sp. L3-i20]|uniref:DUF6713 family protein n=1 Tax=Paenibacillus sp. L3-i20 TaxID=2905833 RepID=UPI002852740C|nr:DUF6713 family protein [Paenibacillus sp. L3-i20]